MSFCLCAPLSLLSSISSHFISSCIFFPSLSLFSSCISDFNISPSPPLFTPICLGIFNSDWVDFSFSFLQLYYWFFWGRLYQQKPKAFISNVQCFVAVLCGFGLPFYISVYNGTRFLVSDFLILSVLPCCAFSFMNIYWGELLACLVSFSFLQGS